MTTIALAGRRIDAPDAPRPRFPLSSAPQVEARLRDYFRAHRVGHLVCSAACGADLLALRAGAEAGVARRTIVLPFDAASFRASSVTDRPGHWGALYERMVADARSAGTLVVLQLTPGDEGAYQAATRRIIEEAARGGPDPRACVVWEGASRGEGDHSMALGELARARGWPVDSIPTL